MKKICTIAALALASFSASAFAAPLTQQQCHSYPFKPVSGEVTHAQLMQELGELEAAGYHPLANDPYYPGDIQHAEKKLRAKYRRDCMSNTASTGMQG